MSDRGEALDVMAEVLYRLPEYMSRGDHIAEGPNGEYAQTDGGDAWLRMERFYNAHEDEHRAWLASRCAP